MSDSLFPQKLSESGKQSLLETIQALAISDPAVIEELAKLVQPSEPQVIDLWELTELASSFWVLMLGAVHTKEELAVASNLLLWKALSAKDSVRVVCVQRSDRRQYRCCSKAFKVHRTPTLIIGDSPFLERWIEVEPEALFALAGNDQVFHDILGQIHSIIENGGGLLDAKRLLKIKDALKSLNLMYTEAKGFLKITIDLSK